MLTVNEALLETRLQKIARIIAKRMGITVEIRGGKAYVDLERMVVVLPSTSDAAMKDLAPFMDGFLDHECAHVKFTTPSVCREAAEESKVLHWTWNAIEDCWIEREMSAEYYGCGQNLEALNRHVFAKIEAEWESKDMFNRLILGLIRCWRGDCEASYYAADPLMGDLIQAMPDEIEEGRKCSTSQGALDLARKILERIKDVAEQEPQPQDMKPEGQPGDGDGDDQKSGDQSEQNDEQGAQGDESEDGDDSGPQSDSDGDDSDEGGDGSGDSDQQDESEDGDEQDGKSGKPDPKAAQEQAKSFLENQESFEKPLDTEGFVNDQLTEFNDWSTSRDPDEYVIFSEDEDRDVEFTTEDRVRNSKEYARLKDEVRGYIGNMSSMLELSLAAQTEARWIPGARRGKRYDRRRMAAWMMGSDDDRLFKQYEQGEKLDTVVTLLWDCSGSMGRSDRHGSKAALARIAAVAFHEALKRCGIPHEVLGFNTGGGYSDKLGELAREASRRGEDLDRYSRIEELNNHFVFVPFGSNDGRAIANITGGAANRDGEAVLWAAKRLAARHEQRKILIVGSDGHPQGARYHRTEENYLRQVVQQVMKAGLEVHAIGIQDKSVQKFYPSWTVIQKIDELPRTVMRQLQASLYGAHEGTERNGGVRAS